jgi:hypothetical protein
MVGLKSRSGGLAGWIMRHFDRQFSHGWQETLNSIYGNIVDPSTKPVVDVAVVAHPAPLYKEDFDKVNVPISFICSEGFVTVDKIFTGTYSDLSDFFPPSVKMMAQ